MNADLEMIYAQVAYGNDLAIEQIEAEATGIREYGVDFDGTYLRHRGPHSGIPINGGVVQLWGRYAPEAEPMRNSVVPPSQSLNPEQSTQHRTAKRSVQALGKPPGFIKNSSLVNFAG